MSTCKTNYEKVGNVCKKKGVTCSSNSECKSNKCLGGSCCKDSMEDPNCKICHSLTDSHPGACLVCNNGYAKNSSTGWKCKKLILGKM